MQAGLAGFRTEIVVGHVDALIVRASNLYATIWRDTVFNVAAIA